MPNSQVAGGDVILAGDGNEITIGTTAPSSPTTGWIWVDTTTRTKIKKWDGSAWLDVDIRELLTTTGDLPYASGALTPNRLAIGSTGQILRVVGGIPAWSAPLNTANAYSSSDTSLVNSGMTSLTGVSISLGAGTWLIIGHATLNDQSAGASDATVQLYNSTDAQVLADGQAWSDGTTGTAHGHTVTLAAIAVLGGTKTIVLRGQHHAGAGSWIADTTVSTGGTTNRGCSIWAVQIA